MNYIGRWNGSCEPLTPTIVADKVPVYHAFQIIADKTTVVRRAVLLERPMQGAWVENVSVKRVRGEGPDLHDVYQEMSSKLSLEMLSRCELAPIPAEVFESWKKTIPMNVREQAATALASSPFEAMQRQSHADPALTQGTGRPVSLHRGGRGHGVKDSKKTTVKHRSVKIKKNDTPQMYSGGIDPPSDLDAEVEPKRGKPRGNPLMTRMSELNVAVDGMEGIVEAMEKRLDQLCEKVTVMDDQIQKHVNILVKAGLYFTVSS